MTKAELTALARRKKIKVSAGLLKDDLIKTVKKGLRKLETAGKTNSAAKKSLKTAQKAKAPVKKRAKAVKNAKTKKASTKKPVTAKNKKAVTKKAVKKSTARQSPATAKKAAGAKPKPKARAGNKAAAPAQKKTADKATSKKKAPRKTAARKTPPVRSSTPPRARSAAAAGLPSGYGDNRLVMMARDPYWAYVYWDLTPTRMRDLSRQARHEAGHPRWVLRAYSAPLHPVMEKGGFFDVEIDIHSGSYYLNLSRPGARFLVEIGVVDAAGMFHGAAQSNPVIMPMDHPVEGNPAVGSSGTASFSTPGSSWKLSPSSGGY